MVKVYKVRITIETSDVKLALKQLEQDVKLQKEKAKEEIEVSKQETKGNVEDWLREIDMMMEETEANVQAELDALYGKMQGVKINMKVLASTVMESGRTAMGIIFDVLEQNGVAGTQAIETAISGLLGLASAAMTAYSTAQAMALVPGMQWVQAIALINLGVSTTISMMQLPYMMGVQNIMRQENEAAMASMQNNVPW